MADGQGQALKVDYHGEIRRFVVPALSLDEVIRTVAQRFCVSASDVKLFYVDPDGDLITVTCDEELQEAARVQSALRFTMALSTEVTPPKPKGADIDQEKVACIVADLLRKHEDEKKAKDVKKPSEGHLLSLLEGAAAFCGVKAEVLGKVDNLTPEALQQQLLLRPKLRNILARFFSVLGEDDEDMDGPKCCRKARNHNKNNNCNNNNNNNKLLDDEESSDEEVLSLGSSGKGVLTLQKRLARLGYLQRGPRFWAARGGTLETMTMEALAAFQRANDLPEGPADAACKAALLAAVRASNEAKAADAPGLIPAREELAPLPAAPLPADREAALGLHKALAFAGYLTPLRPKFWEARAGSVGPWTRQALAHLQRDHGLEASGEWSEATAAALGQRVEAVEASGERTPASALTEEEAALFPPFAARRPAKRLLARSSPAAGVSLGEVPAVPEEELAEGAAGAAVEALHRNLARVGALQRPPMFWHNGKAAVFGPYTRQALRALGEEVEGLRFDAAAREALRRRVAEVEAEQQSVALSAIPLAPWHPAPPAPEAALPQKKKDKGRLPAPPPCPGGKPEGTGGALEGLPEVVEEEVGKGASGPVVAALQRNLAAAGLLDPPPRFWATRLGQFGGQTLAAVKALQRTAGLPLSGRSDAPTRAALRARVAEARARAPPPGASTDEEAGPPHRESDEEFVLLRDPAPAPTPL